GQLGVGFLRRWMVWAAVIWAALFKKGGRTGWLGEGWRVILLTLLAAPFVLPPALVIVVALEAFTLFDLAIWTPLALVSRTNRVAGRPRKRVNRPTFDWKLS